MFPGSLAHLLWHSTIRNPPTLDSAAACSSPKMCGALLGGARPPLGAVPPCSGHRRSLAGGIFEDFDHLGIEQPGNL
jgi:hypothetical protein